MSLYQAMVNLSVPRAGDTGKETDLVRAGETVDLTDEQAARWLPPVRAFPMVRPAGQQSEALPRIHPKQMSAIAINPRTGKLIGGPGVPSDARPDPPGSSQVTSNEPPEADEPQPDSEQRDAPQDAVDIAPQTRRGGARAAARAR